MVPRVGALVGALDERLQVNKSRQDPLIGDMSGSNLRGRYVAPSQFTAACRAFCRRRTDLPMAESDGRFLPEGGEPPLAGVRRSLYDRTVERLPNHGWKTGTFRLGTKISPGPPLGTNYDDARPLMCARL